MDWVSNGLRPMLRLFNNTDVDMGGNKVCYNASPVIDRCKHLLFACYLLGFKVLTSELVAVT
jgi:hypothetical protein